MTVPENFDNVQWTSATFSDAVALFAESYDGRNSHFHDYTTGVTTWVIYPDTVLGNIGWKAERMRRRWRAWRNG